MFPFFLFSSLDPDRNHKQYFYMKQSTGESQWEYPLEAMQLEQEKIGVTGKEDSQAAFTLASSVEGAVYNKDSLLNMISSTGKLHKVDPKASVRNERQAFQRHRSKRRCHQSISLALMLLVKGTVDGHDLIHVGVNDRVYGTYKGAGTTQLQQLQ